MVDVAVDAPIRQEAKEVDRTAGFERVFESAAEFAVIEKGATGDGMIDAGEILVDDTAGAEVEMAYL